MAKNRTSFKKGQIANPKGRKPLPADVRASRNMSHEELCRTVIEVRNMTYREALTIDKDLISLAKRAILNAYVKLDYRGIKEYEDRLWGKAQEKMMIGMNSEAPVDIEVIIKLDE